MKEFSAEKIPLSPDKLSEFKSIDLKYWTDPAYFKELLSFEPDLNNIPELIEIKKKTYNQRQNIIQILKNQYSKIEDSIITNQIIALQSENCFTVVCAHQAVMLGGPLYWWYKICHTIGLCKSLSNKFPNYKFVPIYYAGTEDHDLDEINHLHIFNKKYIWDNSQSGATGRMSVENIASLLDEVKQAFQNSSEVLIELDEIKKFLNDAIDYADFFRKFVHHLFGKHGLLFFNPDDKEAKSLFKNFMKNEVENNFVEKYTSSSIQKLSELSFQAQAHVREINLFYLSDQYRVGIYKDKENYCTKDEQYRWSKSSILKEIDEFPDRFSPNVLTRPLYQEFLFPNLIFIGGGAEVAYWMQLKSVFEHLNITYPILFRRFSGLIINENLKERIRKTGVEWMDYLEDVQSINTKYLKLNSSLISGIKNSQEKIDALLKHHAAFALNFSSSFQSSFEAELTKLEQQLDKLSAKLFKEEKSTHEVNLNKIQKIKDSLFPNKNLQERQESGLTYYLEYGQSFIEFLINNYKDEDRLIVYLIKE
ncbi:MAG: bacillithiol biosynthesis cysteine-adding enzyme BshC [Saprospiraceae bacterium]